MLPEETQKEINKTVYWNSTLAGFSHYNAFNDGMDLIDPEVDKILEAKSEEDFSKALDSCIDVCMQVALTTNDVTKDDYDNYLDTIVSAIDNKSSDDELLEVAKSDIDMYKWVINTIGTLFGAMNFMALKNPNMHFDLDQWMKNSIELAKKNLDEAAKVVSEPAEGESLVELSRYITLSSQSKAVIVDWTALKGEGYHLEIH